MENTKQIVTACATNQEALADACDTALATMRGLIEAVKNSASALG